MPGIDPQVAVSVPGHGNTIYLEPGTCTYAFPGRALFDLRACLRTPVRLSLPSSDVNRGMMLTTWTDRRIYRLFDGATLYALVESPELAPTRAADRRLEQIGTLHVDPEGLGTVSFEVPGVSRENGGLVALYVSCPPCGEQRRDSGLYPAGTLSVPPWRASALTIGLIAAGIVVAAVMVAAARRWRRVRRRAEVS
jgi:hypothetical protein